MCGDDFLTFDDTAARALIWPGSHALEAAFQCYGAHGQSAQIPEDTSFTDIESVRDFADRESLLSELTCTGWFCFGGSLLPTLVKRHASWRLRFPPVVVPCDIPARFLPART